MKNFEKNFYLQNITVRKSAKIFSFFNRRQFLISSSISKKLTFYIFRRIIAKKDAFVDKSFIKINSLAVIIVNKEL